MRQQREGQAAVAASPESLPSLLIGTGSRDDDRATRPGRATQLWAIASGKGGVGRSFLAANLGCVLARDVGPVTLADLDFSGGDLHTALGETAGASGLTAFVQRRVSRLDVLVRQGEVPGLGLVQGLTSSDAVPNGRTRARILRALRGLEAPLALLDLESGSSRAVLDFFVAADRPILVVLPEPAAVENAHRFIKQVYVRQLESLASVRGVDRRTFRQQLERENWRPVDLLTRLDRLEPGLGQVLQGELERFKLYLVINQVRHISDVGVGQSLKNAVQSYFGISVRFVGAVGYDNEAWLSTRRRKLRVREVASEIFGGQLEQVAQNLLSDVELEPVS